MAAIPVSMVLVTDDSVVKLGTLHVNSIMEVPSVGDTLQFHGGNFRGNFRVIRRVRATKLGTSQVDGPHFTLEPGFSLVLQ